MAPSPRRPRPPLPRRIVAAALNQLPLKLAALLFSFVLWLAVSAEEPTDEWVPVHISLSADSSISLREPIPAVRAFVIGRGRELLKLYVSEPTVHRTIDDVVQDSLVIPLKASDVVLPAWVDADVREIEPHAITLHFTVTAARKVPVRSALRVRADSGWRITGEPRFDPESVTVRGPRASVRAIRAVHTVPQAIVVHDSGPQTVPLDTNGLGARVQPEVVQVFVPAIHEAPALSSDSTPGATGAPKPAPVRRGTRPRRGAPRPPTHHRAP